MRHFIYSVLIIILSLNAAAQKNVSNNNQIKIDRKAVVERHKIITTSTNPKSPAQVGNGEFAFGVDITGLQSFVPFNTLSHWSWHSFPVPDGLRPEDFKGDTLDTHGRGIRYEIPNKEQPELSSWLEGNPHRFNLGRIGFLLLKSDGTRANIKDLNDTRQEVDMWNGIIYSSFTFEGHSVKVKTSCHPSSDIIGVSVESDLINMGQLMVFLDFPYADSKKFTDYIGNYYQNSAHSTKVYLKSDNSAQINRKMDDTEYYVHVNWTNNARFLSGAAIGFFQCRSIIHSISCHANDVSKLLQNIHNMKLVFRKYLGKTISIFN